MFSQWAGGAVEIPVIDGDCRRGAHLFLALVAYPKQEDRETRAEFCDGAMAAYARTLKADTPGDRAKINRAFSSVLGIPAQQSRNVVRMGMRRVGQRLTAAVIVRRQLSMTPSGLKWVLNSDGPFSELRVVNADDPLARPQSMTSTIKATMAPFGSLMPLGDGEFEGVKNIQDRVVRPNLPIAHLSHALLARLSRRSYDDGVPGNGRAERWQEWLLQDPSWIEEVVPAAMNSCDALWLMCRESGLIFSPDEMIPVALVRRAADTAA